MTILGNAENAGRDNSGASWWLAVCTAGRRKRRLQLTDWSVIYSWEPAVSNPFARFPVNKVAVKHGGDNARVSVDHYENFPVASVLCPPRLRPAVAAIYWFARTADDIADEGDALPLQRLADLAAYRGDLDAVVEGREPSARWQSVFMALANTVREHRLPASLLRDLLSAFEQ